MSAPSDETARTRRLITLYGLTAFTTSLASRSLDPILPEIARDFAVATDQVALLASAFALPYALVQPFLGPVGDALGKRRIIALATLLTGLALVACALTPGLGLLFAFRALAGAAAGGIYPLVIATFGDRVPQSGRQVALSRLLAFSTAGQIAGGVVSGLVHGFVDWRGIIAGGAVAVLAMGLVLWRDLRREPDPPPGRLDAGSAARRYREIIRLPAARRLYASVATEGLFVFGMFPYLAALIAGWGLGGAAQAGFAIGAFGASGIAYTFLAGPMLSRLGLPAMQRLAGVVVALGFLAIASAAWGLPLGVLPVVVGMFAIGLGYFTMHNSLQMRVTEIAPRARGSAVALHAFSFFVGQSLGPLLFGTLLAGLGAVPALLVSGAAMLGLGLGLSRVMRAR
ncbi:Predicted arabinose efflux permease, MFS family [Roseomonas rosea]|uniref:Predicted arabinose efflux permease, MFS family n=1 Tax=Muricoccus roseus TaxID=198092 RepID=A0A1M6GFC8_9PROT|nr:MFS transporter [Roseomonas rosea]SHJ08665.1 Predicted arabinose efflux permease, MFS family [Roseomonas rosea]